MGTFPITLIARIKHGYLREAIKARGWTQKQAAIFLGVSESTLGELVRLTWIPSQKWLTKERQEKFLELTGKLPEDLWPEALRTKEFIDIPKTIEATREVPLHLLARGRESLALPPTPEEILMNKDLTKGIKGILSTLTQQQQKVIAGIFLEEKTQVEVGRDMGKSKERIRQIEEKALWRLRNPKRMRILKSLVVRENNSN